MGSYRDSALWRRGVAAIVTAAMVLSSTPVPSLAEAELDPEPIVQEVAEAAAEEQQAEAAAAEPEPASEDGVELAVEAEPTDEQSGEAAADEQEPTADPVSDQQPAPEPAAEQPAEPQGLVAEAVPESTIEEDALLAEVYDAITLGKKVTLKKGAHYSMSIPADGYLTMTSSTYDAMVSVFYFDRYANTGARLTTKDAPMWPSDQSDASWWYSHRGTFTEVGVQKGTAFVGSHKDQEVTITFHPDDYRDYDGVRRTIQLGKGAPNKTYVATSYKSTLYQDSCNPLDAYTFTLSKRTPVQIVLGLKSAKPTDSDFLPNVTAYLLEGERGFDYVSNMVEMHYIWDYTPGALSTVVVKPDPASYKVIGQNGNDTMYCGYASAPSAVSGDVVTLDPGTYTVVTQTDSIGAEYTLSVVDKSKFPDVPSSFWAVNVISRAAALGLMGGYTSGSKAGCFGPYDNVTRGQVAVMLWNMAGRPGAGAGAKSFPDVASGKYYYNAVRWASSKGVVSGFANGMFGPDKEVTREQFAVMLANYARYVAGESVSGTAADYASMGDAGKVSSWARQSVGWCFRNMIISGKSGGMLDPQGTTTRAEAAKMLVFLYDMLH